MAAKQCYIYHKPCKFWDWDECEHFATAIIAGQEVLCRFPILRQYCVSVARIYYVGMDEPPPESEVLKILKQFKRFKYCPKCGQKLDFLTVAGDSLFRLKE